MVDHRKTSNEELTSVIFQKIGPLQTKIAALETSISQKNIEILLLSLAYERLLNELSLKSKVQLPENKESLEKDTPKSNKNPALLMKKLLIPPNKGTVNLCLQNIKAQKFFAFVDLPTLIKVSRVCKVWRNQSAQVLNEFYEKNAFQSKEERHQIIQELETKERELSSGGLISFLTKDSLANFKSMKICPKSLNLLFIALLYCLGETLDPEDLNAPNVFAKKAGTFNVFLGKLMGFMSRKGISQSSLKSIKQILDELQASTPEGEKKITDEGAKTFLSLVNTRLTWEEYLNSHLGSRRILMIEGAIKFFEATLPNRLVVGEEKL